MKAVFTLAAAVLLLIPGLVAAEDVAAPALALQYVPVPGDGEESILLGKLADLQLNNASLGITGQVTGKMKLGVLPRDVEEEENGNFRLRMEFSDLEADFAGQARTPSPIHPAEITVSRTGEVVKINRPGMDAEATPAAAGLEALTAGGIPLDVVAFMATSLRLPQEPVSVGGSWTLEEEMELPILGKTKVSTTTTLVKVEDGRATLRSTYAADVPPFEMEHPLMQGMAIKVQSGRFSSESVERELDIARSLVVRAKGDFKVQLLADMGFGMPTPLAALGQFDLRPAVEPEEPPAPQEETDTPVTPGPQASRPGVTLGPLEAAAEHAEGTVSLRVGVDLSRAPLPAALSHLRPLLNTTRAGVEVQAGVRGAEAGRLGLGGAAQMGPWARRGDVGVDLRAVAESILAAGLGLLRRVETLPAPR